MVKVVGEIGSVAGKERRRFLGQSKLNLRLNDCDLKQVIETSVPSSLPVIENRGCATRQGRSKKNSFWVASRAVPSMEQLRLRKNRRYTDA